MAVQRFDLFSGGCTCALFLGQILTDPLRLLAKFLDGQIFFVDIRLRERCALLLRR